MLCRMNLFLVGTKLEKVLTPNIGKEHLRPKSLVSKWYSMHLKQKRLMKPYCIINTQNTEEEENGLI